MGVDRMYRRLGVRIAGALWTGVAAAQQPALPTTDQRVTELERQVAELKALVHQLQNQLASGAAAQDTSHSVNPAAPGPTAVAAVDPLHGITFNALLDGYYEYNVNSPLGRANSLRAYDVSSNSFSLNQADLVIERAPDLAANRRFGMRLDLQYGQATSTLQGNPANELRPNVYRNVFQAYGTYVVPLAAGLTVDFGKWASSLGIEGNYTQDQLNYSRSFWFDYLPFYHMGLRSKLAFNDQVALNVWITNGTNQTEAFNNYKDQMIGIVVTPAPAISWTLNIYQGQEHPDVAYVTNTTPAQSNLPYQQGTYILPIAHPPNGKLEIVDSYLSWQVNDALLAAAEVDYVQERLYRQSAPQRVSGGALYAAYRLTPQWTAAARAEYLEDQGGLYSGVAQYLKEGTLSLDYRPSEGMLLRGEYRRDQSDRPYFLGHSLGDFKTVQPTLGIGVVWWFGQKPGTW